MNINLKSAWMVLFACVTLFIVGCQTQTVEPTPETPVTEAVVPKAPIVNPCPECGQKQEFRGEFVYFADSAILQVCGSGMPLAVLANPKMQLAYELHRSAPEAPLYFVATGQVELRPSMEEGLMQKVLIIDGDNWYFDARGRCQ
ncbi:hypothetical protein [Thorsellia anophelis]|uniref:Copper homeostasis protein (Lipoprotein) n=1 Tax=Thorsellia anophelis DSM 18579 TaxID=1123402 RepID=A0A1I0B197_9GAMM|nr:hypothetical protein [Thorsellia anophelis]SET00469.1 copper homeostasis protein (lipoprotein) [Thorsellia anophelis DSM 18579]